MRRWLLIGFAAVVVMALVLALAPIATASACPDCKSPGYWKNHDCWPVSGICIGGTWYPMAQAQEMMKQVPGDKWYTLFRSYVAAKLNLKNGCYTPCYVTQCIWKAKLWLAAYQGEVVPANSEAWQCGGECLYYCLDRYNNS